MIVNVICKFIQWILKKSGRGTAFPGIVALRLNRNFLARFKKPDTVIFVTGTVGKTTTAAMIADIFRKAGCKVGANSKGSNLLPGICSLFIEYSSITGNPKVDVMVVEVDERFVKRVLPYVTPDYFVINNISRDQLARNGHFEIVFHDINDHIDEKPHLILNADNPLSYMCSLGRDNKITYFGVEQNRLSTKESNDKPDVTYCPVCSERLVYDYFNYGNFGSYYCPACGFKRQEPTVQVEIREECITVDGETVMMPDEAIYNAYNIGAAYAAATQAGLKKEVVLKALNSLSLNEKRFQEFSIGQTEGIILVSKNETPTSYNQSLEHISRCDGKKTVAIGFTRISGRYNEKDISWLYDINFGMLNDDSIEQILLIGPYAYDLAVRLSLEGINIKENVTILTDYEKTYEALSKCKSKVYCVFYFDMSKKLVKKLKEQGDHLW